MDFFRKPTHDPSVLKRAEAAFDLYETGQIIMRQNLRRRHPDLDGAEIEQRLAEWNHRRPGAEHGAGPPPRGRPIPKDKIGEWLASRRS